MQLQLGMVLLAASVPECSQDFCLRITQFVYLPINDKVEKCLAIYVFDCTYYDNFGYFGYLDSNKTMYLAIIREQTNGYTFKIQMASMTSLMPLGGLFMVLIKVIS